MCKLRTNVGRNSSGVKTKTVIFISKYSKMDSFNLKNFINENNLGAYSRLEAKNAMLMETEI
jgi:hypothetical protein